MAFLGWRTTASCDRSKVLTRAAELLRADKRAFAEILTQEMGKIIAEAEAEVELSAEILDYFADRGAGFLEDQPLGVKDPSEGTVTIVHEPLRVIYAIEPWNFPYYQVIRVAAPQILAGNTIVLKHAENVPASALAMQKLFDDAGLPDAVFCNLFAPISATDHILAHPGHGRSAARWRPRTPARPPRGRAGRWHRGGTSHPAVRARARRSPGQQQKRRREHGAASRPHIPLGDGRTRMPPRRRCSRRDAHTIARSSHPPAPS